MEDKTKLSGNFPTDYLLKKILNHSIKLPPPMPNLKKPSELFRESYQGWYKLFYQENHWEARDAVKEAKFRTLWALIPVILDELYKHLEQQDKEIAELKKQPIIKFISKVLPDDSIRMHNNCTCCRPDAVSSTFI